MNNFTPELKAKIYYIPKSESAFGRTKPVFDGYRGQFYYDGKNWDAPQKFINKEICYPGESVLVYLETASTAAHLGKFFVGKKIEIREGARTVGKGEILEILREDFKLKE
jgi:translation elongation factor EF-Tu-like GTPase